MNELNFKNRNPEVSLQRVEQIKSEIISNESKLSMETLQDIAFICKEPERIKVF